MSPAKDMIERQFDEAAAGYDQAGQSVFGRFGAHLAGLVPVEARGRVLDVATGTGAALLPMAHRLGPEGRAVGIDLSNRMIEEAGRKARAMGLTNVELLKMDAERLEFPDQTFDAVVCAHGIFLFPDRDAALREMFRVTKWDGRVGISSFGDSPPAFMPAWTMLVEQLAAYKVEVEVPNAMAHLTMDEMDDALVRAGFCSVDVYREVTDIVYPSEDEWWEFLLTTAPRPAILSMDAVTQACFKQEYLDEVRSLFRADGLHLPVSMVYATGLR